MKSALWIAIGVTIANIGSVIAGGTAEAPPLRLRLELVDGSRIVGVPATTSVVALTPYALLDIPLQQVRSLVVATDRATVTLRLANGDAITGAGDMAPIGLSTVFGEVSIGFEHVDRLQVLPGGSTESLLSNRLRSREDILSSLKGPNGRIEGNVSYADSPPGVALSEADATIAFPSPFGKDFPESGTIEFLWTPSHDENTSANSFHTERFPFVIASRETREGSAWPALVFYMVYRSHGGYHDKTVITLGTGPYRGLPGVGSGLVLDLNFKAGQPMHVAINWDAQRTDRLLRCYIDGKEAIPEAPSAPSPAPSPAEIVRTIQAQYARLSTELELLRYSRRPDGAERQFDAGQSIADLKIWDVAKDVFEDAP